MVLSTCFKKMTQTLWPKEWQSRVYTVTASLLVIYTARKVLQGYKKRQLRKKWDAVKEDVVLLHQFNRGRFCPNLSPFALKVETFLRLANIEYEVDDKSPFGPKGKCPWITINGEDIGDSEWVLEHLTRFYNVDLDSALEKREAAFLEAVRVLADEHLFWCVLSWRYWLDGCTTFLKTQRLGAVMQRIFPFFMKNGIKKRAMAQGIGFHSPEEIYQICKKDCSTLAAVLGERQFFGGDVPCRVDCAVFGQLAQLMWNAPGTKYQALLTEVHPTLAAYCMRMKQRVFPDWDSLLIQ